ncbi:hypothetical protein [Brumicola blandensis]|uniref:Uncharacterized protein n=1 Tax=Brumicola blandensis TaxID=3075611 RepID=A0AAW8QZN4_9ALTE|nr:hypothetical protein [Alteromonas sp. W409]MDT0581438.1 hypothetical protein [Alteromonas sp. W409]
MEAQEISNTLSTADWASIVSAGAAAIAAILSLIAILFTIDGNKKKEKENDRQKTYILLSHLIEVDLALDDAIRDPIPSFTKRVKNSVLELLKSLALNGVMQKYESLPTTCEKCLIFMAELQFTQFVRDEMITQLSQYELDFRRVKITIEKEFGIIDTEEN